jgi:TRAP-type mannitol/chloroaromatic compound transport system permease small subunit
MDALHRAAAAIDRLTVAIGRAVAWAALAMVLAQFALVVLRYAFGIGSIAAQEAVVWAHGALFLLASPYAFAVDGHVRVDVFYRAAGRRRRAATDLAAAFVLLCVSAAILWTAWPYAMASWASLEGSRETSGLAGVYLQKTLILLFAGLLFVQGLSLAVRNGMRLAAPPTPHAAGPGD